MGVINYTTAKINDFLKKVEEAPEKLENGKTPVFITGTTTTLDPGLSATAEVVLVGTDSEGNPQYKINFGVPKGLDGAGGSGGGVADSVQWANVLNKPSWVNSATKPSYTASEVGALPAGTFIPTKTSDIENDRGFLTSDNFKTINGQSIVGEGNITIQEGGGSSGGTGNVNVTNVSTLRNNRFYSFKPSEDGSSVGVFSELPNAGTTNDGLMTSEDYEKLITIKSCVYLPIAFEQVNSSTTKEELMQLFSSIPDTTISNYGTLVYFLSLLCSISNAEGDVSLYRFYIGNNDCFFRGTYSEDGTNLQADFTYIAIGGKLRTISINMSNIDSSDLSSAELSINVIDSDDDSYYLPNNLYNLNPSSTESEITSALGGSEGVEALKDAMKANKKIYVISSTTIYYFVLPVSYSLVLNTVWAISFVIPEWGVVNTSALRIRNIISTKVKDIYPGGFWLKSSFYDLKSSSSSEDISSAIGGESGMKDLIQAISDGNRVYILNNSDLSGKTDILCNLAKIEENGNMTCVFFGMGDGLWGGSISMLALNYEKTSNTFSVNVTSL